MQASGIFRQQLPTDARLMTDAAQAHMKMSAVHLPENSCSESSCSRQPWVFKTTGAVWIMQLNWSEMWAQQRSQGLSATELEEGASWP